MNERDQRWHNIPEKMKALPNWVYWKFEERDGKMTKIPYNARSGYPASSTDPKTWSEFDRAVRTSVNGDGIGFVFTKECGLVGIDLDHNIDMEIVDWFDSYTERSQSGQGIHIIVKGIIPDYVLLTQKGGRKNKDYEVYSTARYFCMTGDVIKKNEIQERQGRLDEFIAAVFTTPEQTEKKKEIVVDLSGLLGPSTHFEPSIIDEIRQSAQGATFDELWSGGLGRNPSESEADMALLSILRWWTSGDESLSISLFLQSPRADMRKKKCSRADYLPNTWAKLSGEVRDKIEELPSFVIKAKTSPAWRKITIEHVGNAIENTILEPLTYALCTPSKPALPLEVGLAKALSLCGCALSGPKKGVEEESLGEMMNSVKRGVDLARVRIMTAGGQVPNFWTLLVGESSSGKDMGNLLEKAALNFKWLIGNSGSEEGIADAYVSNPVGLLAISEMSHWLDANTWQSKATGFLTATFNKGFFSYALSKRGKDAKPRESNYCYPNIQACIQEKALQYYATSMHVETGFLGRFMIINMPEAETHPLCDMLDKHVETIINRLTVLNSKKGDVVCEQDYDVPLSRMFFDNKAEPRASWRRLTLEYYPRLALLLSIPAMDDSTTVEITPEGWRKAEILVQYLFSQAEQVLLNLHFDKAQSKLEALCSRIEKIIRSKPSRKMLLSDISRVTSHGTNAKDRTAAISELKDRGIIYSEKTPRGSLLSLRLEG